MKRSCFTLLTLVGCLLAAAQTPAFPTSGDIYSGLKKLNVLGSVLYVAAHPDDENTRLLTYFSKDKLYRTGYLSITRGDGGQNLIGEEQGIELGLIRTQELLAARRIDGAEQFFTRAYDFGFSKSPQETLTKWDKEKILSDVVWVIRKFQPDVIITRFPTTGEGGHGHHTASAMLALEAFNVAADPTRFPEQLQYVQPWQAKRLLWNTFNFGGNNTTNTDQFKIDAGGYNPVLGKSYGEIAAESRSQHKSQGFGVPRSRGEAIEHFKVTVGSQPTTDLFEDVVTDWTKVAGAATVERLIQAAIASFDFLQPQKSVPQLVRIYKALSALPPGYWRDKKLAETKELIASSSGLWLDVFTNESLIAQGDSLTLNFSLNNRLGNQVTVKKVAVNAFDTSLNKPLEKNKNSVFTKRIFIPATMPVTQPYWLQDKMSEGYFNVSDQKLIGQPDVQPSLTALFTFNIEGQDFVFERPVRYKFTDPVKGEIYWPLTVIPAATFSAIEPLFLKGKTNGGFINIAITANNNIDVPSPILVSQLFDNKKDTIPLLFGGFKLSKNQTHTEALPLASLNEKFYQFNLSPDFRSAGHTMRNIHYDHIPAITYFKPAVTTVKTLDLRTEGKRVGYLIGAGDKVPAALEQMGYEVTLLTEKELSRNNLQQFDAIISGVRAYNTNEWLNAYHDKLMKYVENGGNLIVQYNTSNQIGPVKSKIGPYSFGISRNRITDENATVTFLKPEHPLFHFPNKITQDDFKGWVQERSIYHAEKWDNNYEALLQMNDPGEAPNDGSLIIAKHGKGFFTYTGLVFFRELPAGVPGAYRLLANLIALNKKNHPNGRKKAG